MLSRTSRMNFMNQNLIDGNIENDLAFNNFENFSFKRNRTYFTITEKYYARPDLISLTTLGKSDYWWIIMKLNNIDDVYNDFVLGKTIQIPNINDVEDFLISTRRKVDLS